MDNNYDQQKDAQELEVRMEEAQKESARNLEGWQRAEAELSNYRKDESQRLEKVKDYTREAVIKEFLLALDNFQIAVSHAPPEVRESNKAWFDGLRQTEKNFLDLLAKYGVKKINTEGEVFNPEFHEVLEMSEGEESGKIIEELRAGYKINDRVLRPARVKIIK